jgi:hypothetical protein
MTDVGLLPGGMQYLPMTVEDLSLESGPVAARLTMTVTQADEDLSRVVATGNPVRLKQFHAVQCDDQGRRELRAVGHARVGLFERKQELRQLDALIEQLPPVTVGGCWSRGRRGSATSLLAAARRRAIQAGMAAVTAQGSVLESEFGCGRGSTAVRAARGRGRHESSKRSARRCPSTSTRW